tara:strand:+ start:86 stop:334 length:249 start_codon:yes stop_codon:yes gene_type:complete
MSGDFEQKDMTGVLFPDKEKKSENHPDLTGSVTIEGKKLRLAAWKKTSKAGNAYLSVSVSEIKPASSQGGNSNGDKEDPLPF